MTEPRTNHKFYRFGYTNLPSEGHARLHHSRDGTAFNELTDIFYNQGYRYGTLIHNYHAHRQPAKAFAFLQSGDLIVSTTRLPLDDLADGKDKDKRRIGRSDNHLELAIFNDLRRFFKHLSRYAAILSPDMADFLPPGFERFATINFCTKGKGTISSTEITRAGRSYTRREKQEAFNSVGFFVHLPQISGYPCGFIASFSMGGYENLLWNRIVRLRCQAWFERPVFALALLHLPKEPTQPLSPDIADHAPAKILIEHWLAA